MYVCIYFLYCYSNSFIIRVSLNCYFNKNNNILKPGINNNILKPGIIKQTDVNDHLSIIQSNIISITDSIAPIKCIKIKQKDYYPWVDAELKEIRDQRNFYFNLKNNYDENTIDKKAKANELYVQFRSMFQKLNRIKMT